MHHPDWTLYLCTFVLQEKTEHQEKETLINELFHANSKAEATQKALKKVKEFDYTFTDPMGNLVEQKGMGIHDLEHIQFSPDHLIRLIETGKSMTLGSISVDSLKKNITVRPKTDWSMHN